VTIAKSPAEVKLYADLNRLGIAYQLTEHEAAFTVSDSSALCTSIPGTLVKNLLLRDRGGQFLMLVVPALLRVDLKQLPIKLGCKPVSFAKPADMVRLLGVTPGSVTPLAAINDRDGAVRIILHAQLAGIKRINVHPLRNTATVTLAAADLMHALGYWGHDPVLAIVPERTSEANNHCSA
jgi:Ala-tRNA(Pro) deacylase